MFETAIKKRLADFIRENRYKMERIVQEAVDNAISDDKCESMIREFVEYKAEEIADNFDVDDFEDFLCEELGAYD